MWHCADRCRHFQGKDTNRLRTAFSISAGASSANDAIGQDNYKSCIVDAVVSLPQYSNPMSTACVDMCLRINLDNVILVLVEVVAKWCLVGGGVSFP